MIQVTAGRPPRATAFQTSLGRMITGRSEDALSSPWAQRLKGEVQLVFTSPPFPLNHKKRYGNKQGQEYLEWLAGFGPLLTEFLTPDGSIVIEMGNAWEPGHPTMSTLALESLLAFKERAGAPSLPGVHMAQPSSPPITGAVGKRRAHQGQGQLHKVVVVIANESPQSE